MPFDCFPNDEKCFEVSSAISELEGAKQRLRENGWTTERLHINGGMCLLGALGYRDAAYPKTGVIRPCPAAERATEYVRRAIAGDMRKNHPNWCEHRGMDDINLVWQFNDTVLRNGSQAIDILNRAIELAKTELPVMVEA